MFQSIFLITFLGFLSILVATVFSNFKAKIPSVPSRNKAVKRLIKYSNLKNGYNIYDLGCGDGRILFEVEKKAQINGYKIKGHGYEIAPLPYIIARIKKFLLHSNINIYFKNFLKADFKKADIIFCYLFPNVMEKIALKALKECKKGTRIISHTFKIKNLKPIKIIPKTKKLPRIYIYEI